MADNTVRVEGNYSAKWLSLHSALLKPLYLPQIYKTYGRAFDFFDFLNMPTKKGLVGSSTLKLWEQGNFKANITLSAAITTGSANADINIKIGTSDYDGNNNPVLRIGQTVYIPAKYQTTLNIPTEYQVVSSSGTAGDLTFVARPKKTGAQIGVEIPIGTKLTLGAIMYARGMGLPAGTTQSYFERSFVTGLIKTANGIEGGFLSNNYWEPFEMDGKLMGYTNKLLNDLEFELDDMLNQYIGFGQANDNASLVQTSNFGGSNKVLSGNGIWTMLDASAQSHWYTGSFENADYVTIKNYFEGQGVVGGEAIFAVGSELFDDAEQADLDFIKEYSGGSDLIKNGVQLGMPISKVYRAGMTFNKVKLAGFSNPFAMGNTEYELSSAGFVMPTAKARVNQKADGSDPVYLNNFELYFLGKGEENRTRVLAELNGVSGLPGQAVNEYDGKKFGLLSEPMVVGTNVNQCVIVRKEA